MNNNDYASKINNIMDKAKEDVRTQIDRAYQKGYEDAKSELGKRVINLAHEESDRAYQQGLEDAWEAAKKIHALQIPYEVFGLDKTGSGFTYASPLNLRETITAQEAIAKIKEYEEKQDAIQVGDEVTTRFGKKGVVITNVPCEDGNICVWFPTCTHVQMYPVKDLSKTGRHFPQIAEVLAEMRGDKE